MPECRTDQVPDMELMDKNKLELSNNDNPAQSRHLGNYSSQASSKFDSNLLSGCNHEVISFNFSNEGDKPNRYAIA